LSTAQNWLQLANAMMSHQQWLCILQQDGI